MQICRQCGRAKLEESFIAGKAKRRAENCSTCRRKNAQRHRKQYYARLPPDKRHELTHKRRAEFYGVKHEPYSRVTIMARWNWQCVYCSEIASHLDHIVPLSKGGDDIESNVLPACQDCNLSKGARTLAEWSQSF